MKKINLYDSDEMGFAIYSNRIKRGLTQAELAKLSGISTVRLAQIESGNGRKLDVFTRIMRAMKFDVKVAVVR